jgi:hypothetical protein
MIPEQVWERSGKGTGSATPLAWSMAEFIRLAMKIEKRKIGFTQRHKGFLCVCVSGLCAFV